MCLGVALICLACVSTRLPWVLDKFMKSVEKQFGLFYAPFRLSSSRVKSFNGGRFRRADGLLRAVHVGIWKGRLRWSWCGGRRFVSDVAQRVPFWVWLSLAFSPSPLIRMNMGPE